MARAIATATISFGMVSIPVKLYSATQPSAGVSFNLLHKDCGSRLKQQYICPRHEGQLVAREDMVKGYEFSKDQYVVFTPEELKNLEEKATQTVDIAEFVPLAQIDPIYFDKAYYLGAEKGGEKAYRLLAEVMRQTGLCALARYAARGKGYLVLLRPMPGLQGGGDGLVMQQLLYADEVRPFSEVPVAGAAIKDNEVKLARQLVDQIASLTFNPGAYQDDVRKRIQSDIERKIAGQEIAASEPETHQAQIIDLVEALKASLGARSQERRPPVAAPVVEPAVLKTQAAASAAPRRRVQNARRK